MKQLTVAWLVLAASVAVAADPAGDWMYLVTYRGKPAAGVKVALVPYTYPTPGEPKAGDPTFATSDSRGEVRFARPTNMASPSFARLLARDAAGRGGYGTLYGQAGRYPPTIEMRENAELSGRVTGTARTPIAGLKLKPVALGPDSFVRYGRPTSLADTPDWFWERFPAKLAADGSFTLSGVPVEHSVAVKFEAPGFGSGRFWVMPGKRVAVVLQKAGAIRLRFAAPPTAKPGNIRMTATRAANVDLLEAGADSISKDGAVLTLNDLPPGEYQLAFPYTGSTPLFPKSAGPVTVKPGQTVEVTATLEPAARLTARLVDSKTGKGVPGAKLSATITRGAGDFVPITGEKADADGKIDLLVPAGQVQVTPQAIEGYAVVKFSNNPFNNYSTEPVPIAPGQRHNFGTFALVKTVELNGIVVDEAGKPIAGATVDVGYSGSNSGSVPKQTDDKGRFVIKGLSPEGGVVGVTARVGKRITAAPVAVDPAKPEGEIRVVVSEKFGARIRVRAVDRTGKPIEAVGIDMMHSVRYLSRGSGVIGSGDGGPVGVTSADGLFESDVLQAGDRYTISLTVPGYRAPPLREWVAKLGESRDYGDVVLTQADLAVSGTVTDLAGVPIAGASVFNNADGPWPSEAKTDNQGRFTLKGLYEGPAFVSVRAEGFRLTSAAATPGGPRVSISLRRLSDPLAPAPIISPEHKAATEKLARHVLETMWKNRVAAGDNGKSMLRAMARLDLATARKWRDEEKARTDGKTNLTAEIETVERERTLLTTAKDDADEAVAILKPLGGDEGFQAVLDLGGQLLTDAPDQALRVAEEAVARARGLEEAERAWSLARAGELVWRAGKKAAGRKLIEEAAKLAEPLELGSYRRDMVACRVALFDAAKCRAMIDPIKEASEFNRWLAQACPRLAEHDVALVKKWLADFRPDNSFSKPCASQLVAYRLAGTNPDEAIAVARAIEERTIRATTLAGVAVRLKDKDRAAKLIDAAIADIVADPTGYYNGGASGTAALVLVRAKQVHHPDLAGIRDQVLATRGSPRDEPYSRSNGPVVDDAMALALIDPVTARAVLARRLEPGDLTDLENRRNRDAVLAMALADPAATVPVLDELMSRVIEAKKGYDYTGLDTLASILSRPDRLAETVLGSGRFLGDFREE